MHVLSSYVFAHINAVYAIYLNVITQPLSTCMKYGLCNGVKDMRAYVLREIDYYTTTPAPATHTQNGSARTLCRRVLSREIHFSLSW